MRQRKVSGGAGTRAPYWNGDSLVITLPKRAVRADGIDLDELDGSACHYEVDDGIFSVDLRDAVD